ncbi:MAG: hypothetical protein ACRD0U_01575, partial [Acidimicrobiales bacterium]
MRRTLGVLLGLATLAVATATTAGALVAGCETTRVRIVDPVTRVTEVRLVEVCDGDEGGGGSGGPQQSGPRVYTEVTWD